MDGGMLGLLFVVGLSLAFAAGRLFHLWFGRPKDRVPAGYQAGWEAGFEAGVRSSYLKANGEVRAVYDDHVLAWSDRRYALENQADGVAGSA